jgi:acyl-coenzyme A synthetase/AMP-(fatty) acid ligase
MEMTIVDMLERNAREAPSRAAIAYGDAVTSYSELNAGVNRLARGLMGLGVGRGDMVALMLPRVPELVAAFLAIAKAGAVAAPVNYELTPEKVSSVISGMAPACLITHASHAGLAPCVVPGGRTPVVAVGGGIPGAVGWHEIASGYDASDIGSRPAPGDVVYINYTSGSTGESKGAVTTHSNIYWNTASAVDALGLDGSDVHLCMFAPFAHPHEIFARPLLLGGTMVLVDTIYPKSLAEAIARHGVTCVMGLSPMYENLLELLDTRRYDLGSLRVPESGGMYTRAELIERFRRTLGVPIVPVWGSTETTGIALANRPWEPMASGSVGRPCPSYSVRILDESGADAPVGDPGEMAFRGPGVVSGYRESGAGASEAFRDGWYLSGDIARKDADGNFYFVERKTGMMKIAGLKVFPSEIEQVLLDHPDIKEVGVVAVSDRLRGEVPLAVVALRNGRALSSKDVLRFCKGRLPAYKTPRAVEFMEALPRTPGGKIDKKALRRERS